MAAAIVYRITTTRRFVLQSFANIFGVLALLLRQKFPNGSCTVSFLSFLSFCTFLFQDVFGATLDWESVPTHHRCIVSCKKYRHVWLEPSQLSNWTWFFPSVLGWLLWAVHARTATWAGAPGGFSSIRSCLSSVSCSSSCLELSCTIEWGWGPCRVFVNGVTLLKLYIYCSCWPCWESASRSWRSTSTLSYQLAIILETPAAQGPTRLDILFWLLFR